MSRQHEVNKADMSAGISILILLIVLCGFFNWMDARAKKEARERERQEAAEVANSEYLVSVMNGGKP